MQTYDSYIFYRSWWELLSDLDRDTRDEVVCLINRYVFEGEIAEDASPLAKGVFMGIRIQLDEAKSKYDSIIDKRREAGKRGGERRAINAGQKLKKSQANQANACKVKQNKQAQANQADNDNDVLSTIVDENNNIKDFPDVKSSSDSALSDASFSVSQLIDFWNKCFASHPNVPPLKTFSGNRLRLTKARIGEYGKKEFANAIIRCSKSEFLTNGSFNFNYDWFIKPNNFPKCLEGNYDERTPETKRSINEPNTLSFTEAHDRYMDGDRSLVWAGTDPRRRIITTIEEAQRCELPYQPFKLS